MGELAGLAICGNLFHVKKGKEKKRGKEVTGGAQRCPFF